MEQEDALPNDRLERIKLENEILKIKLKAQFGEGVHIWSDPNFTPEMEHRFLKNVLSIEEQSFPHNTTTVYEKLGKPTIPNFAQLNVAEQEDWIGDTLATLEAIEIRIQFDLGPYEKIAIFKFLTEEIFTRPVAKKTIPGIWEVFRYEDFYPNHPALILQNANQFLKAWLDRKLHVNSAELSWQCIAADGEKFTREDLVMKLQNFFDSFNRFPNHHYSINNCLFEDEVSPEKGMAWVEGFCSYDAEMEDGELLHFEGNFKLYFEQQDNWWSIFYFIMPGYAW